MYCPRCGSNQSDDLKFCNLCGANLMAVRQVIDAKPAESKFDWSKTWVAEMFLSEGEQNRRRAELERERGITPQVKRYTEIKAGVITSSVGLAVMIFLKIFMEAFILGGKLPEDTAQILAHVWAAGIIPLFVGLALIVNGVFVSKKLVELAERERLSNQGVLSRDLEPRELRSPDTTEFIPSSYSVTEETTKHLKEK